MRTSSHTDARLMLSLHHFNLHVCDIFWVKLFCYMASPAKIAPVTPVLLASPGRDGTSSGSFMAGPQARTCCNVGDQCPSSAMCPWGKSNWSCHICKTNYNRRTEQNSKDGKPKDHWKAMSKEEKQDWFKKNKAVYEPNKKHAYDNSGEYVDSNLKGSRHNSDNVYRWLPCDDWTIRQKTLGKCGDGTAEQQYVKGIDLFKAAVLDKTVAKKFEHGQWLIGVYSGLVEKVGSYVLRGQPAVEEAQDHPRSGGPVCV